MPAMPHGSSTGYAQLAAGQQTIPGPCGGATVPPHPNVPATHLRGRGLVGGVDFLPRKERQAALKACHDVVGARLGRGARRRSTQLRRPAPTAASAPAAAHARRDAHGAAARRGRRLCKHLVHQVWVAAHLLERGDGRQHGQVLLAVGRGPGLPRLRRRLRPAAVALGLALRAAIWVGAAAVGAPSRSRPRCPRLLGSALALGAGRHGRGGGGLLLLSHHAPVQRLLDGRGRQEELLMRACVWRGGVNRVKGWARVAWLYGRAVCRDGG